jgi:hypothetical protein
MTYIQNTHRFRGFKFTLADWLKFSLIEKLKYEIDVWFLEKILTNDASFEAPPSRTEMFGWVIVDFHIYYLFAGHKLCSWKHGGAPDNRILVTHPMIDQRCLASAIAGITGPSSSSCIVGVWTTASNWSIIVTTLFFTFIYASGNNKVRYHYTNT